VRVDDPDEPTARAACARLAEVAQAAAARADAASDVRVLGPAPAPLARLRQRYRFRIMLRAADRAALRKVLLAVSEARRDLPRTVRATIDVDPVQLL
jgi:primosomal protein N' (replication factor Y)